MSTFTVTVSGMTCGHCATAVREEVGSIPGVTAVDVHLPSGTVTIDSARKVDEAALKSAVEEAGYELAS